jgi:hypothetical protein
MDANKHFYGADLEKDKKIEQMLTDFKNKFGEEFGADVVLIAYKRNKVDGSWH